MYAKIEKGNKRSLLQSLISTIKGGGTKLTVLIILCLQNTLFTVLRRYSQGVLRETYSKYECLLLGEIIKIMFSSYMIFDGMNSAERATRLRLILSKSWKMFILAAIYGCMNILSFIALRNIDAGTFTVVAQCKILTTATFSAIMLNREYSWTKWRSFIQLMVGVVLFSAPLWDHSDDVSGAQKSTSAQFNFVIGISAVAVEVTLSGFASIYFEKVIKTDNIQLGIWDRNFQLALGSFPIYVAFMFWHAVSCTESTGNKCEVMFGGWSLMALICSMFGAGGGLLVALSIKYGDSILKTLATTGSIILSSLLDHFLLGGPLSPVMICGGIQVVLAICNYTFDATISDEQVFSSIEVGKTLEKKTCDDEEKGEHVERMNKP